MILSLILITRYIINHILIKMVRKKPAITPKQAALKSKLTANIKKPVAKQRTRKKRKSQQSDQQQIQDSLSHNNEELNNNSNNSEQSNQQGSDDEGSSSSSSQSQNSNQQDDEQSSSITPIKPENFAVKQMQFRQRRGTKMNYLMTRKKQEEEDPFWAEHKGYFGDLNGSDEEDEEDYVEDSSGKDQFDSDFGDTQSEHQEEPAEEDQKKMTDELDQQKQKQKKRRAQLMKKVNAYKQKQKPQKPQKQRTDKKPKPEPKTQLPMKKQRSQHKIPQQVGNRFIHQLFTQQQLLGQAAHTEYHNWLSLKKLISIQTQKKDFTRKLKHVEGNKIIYKNRLNQNGVPQTTYELDGVVVNKISDLTNFLQTN